MGLEWDPDGDAERRRDTWKRWLLVIGICGGILVAIFNVLSRRAEERAREERLNQAIENAERARARGF